MRMRTRILALSFCALISTGGLLWAASPVKPIMRGWKTDLAKLDQMIASRQAFRPSEAQRLLTGFATDAQTLGERIKGGGGQAKDLRSRFNAFTKQSSALAALSGRDALAARYAAWRGACKDCHDMYAN